MVPLLSLVMNHRDHRKIVVIDGTVAYTGGVNLADEYINAEQRFGYWKDAALRVEGDAAWNFTVMFLNFWNAFRPSETDYDAFRPMPLVLPVSVAAQKHNPTPRIPETKFPSRAPKLVLPTLLLKAAAF